MKCACQQCGNDFTATGKRGFTPRYCSNACRQRAYRTRAKRDPIPATLRNLDRWTRADGKRPITTDGAPASSTNPTTWTTYDNAKTGPGDGFGIMLGNGLSCYDFDNCLTPDGKVTQLVAVLLGRINPDSVLFVERSVSGRGLHVFVRAPESQGFKRPLFEFYSRARFIRVTGDKMKLEVLAASR